MTSLKVAVRVRPFNNREKTMGAKLVVEMDGTKTRLWKPKALSAMDAAGRQATNKTSSEDYNEFTFDYSYWSCSTEKSGNFTAQHQVYQDLGTDVVQCAFNGYNACVFAYGQTGSGKTYTMMGSDVDEQEQGLIPRICHSLFDRMHKGQATGTGYFKTEVSYLEIYNERVKDLLISGPDTGHKLRVREHKVTGPYVENLSVHPVGNYDSILDCIRQGNRLRTTAATNMNDTSSRSHAIFTITFVQANWDGDLPSETVSKIHLVDLAGSERANATGATGQRLKEGAHINKSLVTLGCVISSLAENSNGSSANKAKAAGYVPYRDSVLTWLLKDSLGGNSKTIMIAAISPADCNYGETLSTLRYANRAKNIINKPTVNEDSNVKLIRELRDEIFKLRRELDSSGGATNMDHVKFLADLHKKEAQEKVLTEEWNEKWREAQNILREQKSLGLRKSGYGGGVVLDSEVPHLIGIHDESSTGVTLYSLCEGETSIGTAEQSGKDIVLTAGNGLDDDDLLPDHCSIVLDSGLATIYPRPTAKCWLNARPIEEPTRISQGDILLLGRNNMFRYNNPMEAAKLRQDNVMSRSSRLDLSRLSMIAASRENLLSASMLLLDNSQLNQTAAEAVPEEEPTLPACLAEIVENVDLLQTIEAALKQLKLERDQMYDEYKNKVFKLSKELEALERDKCDRLAILNGHERELTAKKEMLTFVRNNEQLQIGIMLKQIATLKSDLDSKKVTFSEFVARELLPAQLEEKKSPDELIQAVQQSGDELMESLSKESGAIARNKVEELNRIEADLRAKEELLANTETKVKDLDENITRIDSERDVVLQKTKEEIELINQRKQMLTLNLETTISSNSSGIDGASDDPLATQTSDSYHTAKTNCSSAESKASPTFLDQLCASNYNECLENGHHPIENNDPLTAQPNIMVDSGVEDPLSSDGSDVHFSGLPVLPVEPAELSLAPDMVFSIPNYLIRGAGKQTHYEYEIKIRTLDDRWTLLRRYSRFRDLHQNMRTMYGDAVKQLPFPKKTLFGSKSENVARARRQQLEEYLKALLLVISRMPGSAIGTRASDNVEPELVLTKQQLIEVSSFFKKGLFECGKYGTG